jgi:glutathione S-transferase
MKLLGTPTSPYTRKVRVLLRSLGRAHEFIDTRTDAGAATLAAVAPLGKIPVLVIVGQDEGQGAGQGGREAGVLPDSSLITTWLWATDQAGLRAAGWTLDPLDWADRRLQVIVEGALDAAINHRYLRLDGFSDAGYIAKQRLRVERTLDWLDGRITFQRPLGVAALSLGCALDWIAFRNVVDIARWPALAAFRDAWQSSGLGAGSEPHE